MQLSAWGNFEEPHLQNRLSDLPPPPPPKKKEYTGRCFVPLEHFNQNGREKRKDKEDAR